MIISPEQYLFGSFSINIKCRSENPSWRLNLLQRVFILYVTEFITNLERLFTNVFDQSPKGKVNIDNQISIRSACRIISTTLRFRHKKKMTAKGNGWTDTQKRCSYNDICGVVKFISLANLVYCVNSVSKMRWQLLSQWLRLRSVKCRRDMVMKW